MERQQATNWTAKQVGEWLVQLDLPQYKAKFEELKIDGMLLFEMTETDLIEDLEVKVRLHRFKILESIKRLKETHPEDSEGLAEYSLYDLETEYLSLKCVEGQLLNNTYIIGTSDTRLGRNSQSNDIVISESFVSRRHCEIEYNSSRNQFMLKDVGSTTGTFLMIKQPTQLERGFMVQMGLTEFKVCNIKYNPFGKATELEILFFEGPSRQQTALIKPEGATIGRDSSNTICIREDSQLSSTHCKIYFESSAFYLVDLGSTNRTWMRLSPEGEKSEPVGLAINDVIKIGSTVFVVELPEPGSLPARRPEDFVCKICASKEVDSAFYPCGHFYCMDCASKCAVCPVCNRSISELIRLYR